MVRQTIESRIKFARKEMERNSQEYHQGLVTFDVWNMRDEYYRGLIVAYSDVLDLLK